MTSKLVDASKYKIVDSGSDWHIFIKLRHVSQLFLLYSCTLHTAFLLLQLKHPSCTHILLG